MTLATEISVDAFTLYEYMVNHVDNRLYKGGLLEACKAVNLTSHDHARSRYTRELKASGLVTSRGRTGWQINPSRMPHVTVISMNATVADLLQADQADQTEQQVTPVIETAPPAPDTPALPDHDTYTGAQLAEAVARQLLDRLFQMERQITELKSQPPVVQGDGQELKNLEAKHAELTAEYETFMETAQRNEEELAAKLHREEQLRRDAEHRAEGLQQQIAALAKGLVGKQSADEIRSAAERFLDRSAAS